MWRIVRMRRRFRRRIILGSATLVILGAVAFKLVTSDVKRVEADTGKRVEDLTEAELRDAMRRLGLQRLELTPQDEVTIEKSYVS